MATSAVAKIPTIPDFYAGTHHRFNFTIADYDLDPTGATPKNLTGLVAKWTLARISGGSYSDKYTIQKTSVVDGGIVVTDAANGKLTVELLHADTAKLLGDYHQELELFEADGESTIVAVGDFTILRNVKNT